MKLFIYCIFFLFYLVHSQIKFDFSSINGNIIIHDISFGSPTNKYSLLLDSTTSDIWIAGASTKNLFQNTFTPMNFSTYKKHSTTMTFTYHSHVLTSYYVTDVVYDPSITMGFFIVSNSSKINEPITKDYSGVLGVKKIVNYNDDDSGSYSFLFISNLFKKNIIDYRSLMIEYKSDKKGEITIGQNIMNIKDYYDRCISQINKDDFERFKFFWYCNLKQIKEINDTIVYENNTIFISSTDYANYYFVFDTASKYIEAPQKELKFIFSLVIRLSNEKCFMRFMDSEHDMIVCNRDFDIRKVPDIKFKMNEKILTIYSKDLFDFVDDHYVFKVIESNGEETWFMVEPLIKNYQLILDYEKNFIYLGKTYSNLHNNNNSMTIIWIIIAISTIGLISGVYWKIILVRKKDIY